MDVYVIEYGTKIGATGKRIVLSVPKKEKIEYPAVRVRKIMVLRPASISSSAIKLAIEYDIDVVFMGKFGRPIGRIYSSEPKGLAELRRTQLKTSESFVQSLYLAKQFIKGKCGNQINYLRYLQHKYKKDLNKQIEQANEVFKLLCSPLPRSNKNRDYFFGVEGSVARFYFKGLNNLFEFPGRKPRGGDQLNSALDYAYGILRSEIETACFKIGLDPYLGLYHSDRYGKKSLVLDLMEQFRVPIADCAVFPLFIENKIKDRHFREIEPGRYRLSSRGVTLISKSVLKNLEKNALWRLKKYSMRSIIENETQAIARYFLGKETYHLPFLLENFEYYEQ